MPPTRISRRPGGVWIKGVAWPRMCRMQIVTPLGVTPEAYINGEFHFLAPPPVCCPNCGSTRRLEALGYYERSISATESARVLRFLVRRFRCPQCRRTTSLLPDFAQPYRLVANALIDLNFPAPETSNRSGRMAYLLNRYWRRFTVWLPELQPGLADDFQIEVSADSSASAWSALNKAFSGTSMMTSILVWKSKSTLFGRYRCHQGKGIPFPHTTSLFRSGKDPP